MKKLLLVLLLCAGCTPSPDLTVASMQPRPPTAQETSQTKAQIRGAMRDPESVRYGKIGATTITYATGRTSELVCIWADGKNAYGGYPGAEVYYFQDGSMVTLFNEAVMKSCLSAMR